MNRLKAHYLEWQLTRKLPLWAYFVMACYWALFLIGLIKVVTQ